MPVLLFLRTTVAMNRLLLLLLLMLGYWSGPALAENPADPPRLIPPFSAEAAATHQRAWAEHLKRPLEITDSVGMKLALIPPGEFTMGSPPDEEGHRDYRRLERVFRRLFPALVDVPITHRWAGHVGLTLDRVSTLGAFGPANNIFFAGGYTGHGVSVAVLAGRLLRDLVAGEPLDPMYDFVLNRKPPRAPGEPLTSLGFSLAKRYMRWEDGR